MNRQTTECPTAAVPRLRSVLPAALLLGALLLGVLLGASGGCIPSEPIEPEELDSAWRLHEDITRDAPYYRPEIEGARLPAHWVIRQRKSVIWSTVSIVQAADKIEQGAETVEFSLSPTHTRNIVEVLAETRRTIENLSTIARPEGEVGERRWSRAVATALVDIEHISRLAGGSDEENGETAASGGDLPTGPLMQVFALFVNEQAQGDLLAGFEPGEADELREVLTQVVLRVSFAAAGRRQPPGLRREISARMRQAEKFPALEESLTETLRGKLADAAPVGSDDTLQQTIDAVFTWAPKALEAMEKLVNQWERVDYIEIELRQHEDQLVAVIGVNVLEGKEVRMEGMVIAQPVMAMRGSNRIALIPSTPATGATALLYDAGPDGGVELRFEGIIYGLVRLLAIPLDNAALREVRFFSHSDPRGASVTNVALMMEATGAHADPRRLLVFQDVSHKRLERRAFSVEKVVERSKQIFNYLNAGRRYTYRRTTGAGGQKP